MFTGFAHSELLSLLWPVRAIAPCTLTTGTSANTYDADPQAAAGIDTWGDGTTLFKNLLVVIDVYSITTGTLTVTLRDAKAAITTANGAANTYLVATLADISAAGLYLAELRFDHCFPAAITRTTADEDNATVRRHHSFRATSTGGTSVFSVLAIYGFNSREFPTQDGTKLDVTWVAA
jgi:hypothetical protein